MLPAASALLTDVYQLTMLQAYYDQGQNERAKNLRAVQLLFDYLTLKVPCASLASKSTMPSKSPSKPRFDFASDSA